MEASSSSYAASSSSSVIHDAAVSSVTSHAGAAATSSTIPVAALYASPAQSSVYTRHRGSSSGSSSGSGSSKYQGSRWGQQGIAEEAQPVVSKSMQWGPREVAQLYVEASLLCRDCDEALNDTHTHANNSPASPGQSPSGPLSSSPPLPPPLRSPWVSLRRKRTFFLQLAARSLAEAGSFRDAYTVGALAATAYQEQEFRAMSSCAAASAGDGASAAGGESVSTATTKPSQRRRRPPPPWRDRGTGWWSLQVALLEGKALLADCIRAADAAAVASASPGVQAVHSPNENSVGHASATEVALAAAGSAVGIAGGRSINRVPGAPELRLAVAEMVATLELDFPLLESCHGNDDGAGNLANAPSSTDSTNEAPNSRRKGSVVRRAYQLTDALPVDAPSAPCLSAFGKGPWGARVDAIGLPATAVATPATGAAGGGSAKDNNAEIPFHSKLAAAGGSGSSADALSQLLPIPAAPKPLLSSSAAAEEAASAAAPLIAAQRAALQSLLQQGNSDHDVSKSSATTKDFKRGLNPRSSSRNSSSGGGGAFERRRGAAVALGGHWSADEQADLLRHLAADALAAPPWEGAWSSLPFSLPPQPSDPGANEGHHRLPPPLPSAIIATLKQLHASLGGSGCDHGHEDSSADNSLPSSSTSPRLLRVVSLRPLRSNNAPPLPMPRAMRVVAEAAATVNRRSGYSRSSNSRSNGKTGKETDSKLNTTLQAAAVSFLYSPFSRTDKEDELRYVCRTFRSQSVILLSDCILLVSYKI